MIGLTVWLGYTGLRAVELYSAALQGRESLGRAVAAVRSSGTNLSREAIASIAADIGSANRTFDHLADALSSDPAIGWMRPLPIVGGQVQASHALATAAARATSVHQEFASITTALIDARDAKSGHGGFAGVARAIGDNRQDIDALVAAFREADALVSRVDETSLVGPLQSAMVDVRQELASVRPLVGIAADAARVIPEAFGLNGPRKYLLLALDNAELRPVGGLIGAFATPTTDLGDLRGLRFRDILEVDRPDQPLYVRPPEPLADHLLGDAPWQVADSGWWADFADSAAEAERLFQIETGEGGFAGTIAFTPQFVDALLEVVGPVYVPSAGVVVEAGETYLASLEQVEVLNQGLDRKRFLGELASEVMKRVLSLPVDRYPDLATEVDHAARTRNLQIVVKDDEAMSALERMDWYSPFIFPPGDRLAIIEANVSPVSKLNVLVSMDHRLHVALHSDGSAVETLTTTYVNGYGPDLPPDLERVRPTFQTGILGSYSRRYLDPKAEILSVTNDAPETPVTDADMIEFESGSLAVGNYQLVRPGALRLSTMYRIADALLDGPATGLQVYRLHFRKQAGRDNDTITVHVSIPPGFEAMSWSSIGRREGSTITFKATTEFDSVFEVVLSAG